MVLEHALEPLPIRQSPALLNLLVSGMKKTGEELSNLTKTTAPSSQAAFIQGLDLAYMKVSSGAMSYSQAIVQAVRALADDGVSVVYYETGHRDKVDVAVRRAVLTGVNQTAAQMQIGHAAEMGCDLVETSAHIGARLTHAEWQGRIFSMRGARPEYPDFYAATGYGTGDGLCGWNCRHSFFPFYEGFSTRAYTQDDLDTMDESTVQFDGESMSVYEATQRQRAMEREIRKTKRELSAYDAAMETADVSTQTALREEFTLSSVKLKAREAALRDFERQTHLLSQRERQQAVGFGRSEAQKAVWANKKAQVVVEEKEKAYNGAVATMKARIESGEQPLRLSPQKQARHLSETAPPDKSYIHGAIEDAQWIVDHFAGTGTFQRDHKGNFTPREVIKTDQRVGVAVYGDQRSMTSQFKIHYAKKNTHVVPMREDDA